MAVKTEGKLHAEIVERLKVEGVDATNVAVATLSRGTDHLILSGEEFIGEYNRKSKKIIIYQNLKTRA